MDVGGKQRPGAVGANSSRQSWHVCASSQIARTLIQCLEDSARTSNMFYLVFRLRLPLREVRQQISATALFSSNARAQFSACQSPE